MDMDEDLGEGSSKRNIVSPGEMITSSKEYMRWVKASVTLHIQHRRVGYLLDAHTNSSGHGTYVEGEQVVSSLAGTIERVNKLVSVKALKQRYVEPLCLSANLCQPVQTVLPLGVVHREGVKAVHLC